MKTKHSKGMIEILLLYSSFIFAVVLLSLGWLSLGTEIKECNYSSDQYHSQSNEYYTIMCDCDENNQTAESKVLIRKSAMDSIRQCRLPIVLKAETEKYAISPLIMKSWC